MIFAVFDVSVIACGREQVYKLMFCTFLHVQSISCYHTTLLPELRTRRNLGVSSLSSS